MVKLRPYALNITTPYHMLTARRRPCLSTGDSRPEELVDCLGHGCRRLGPPGVRSEQLQVLLVGHIAKLDQHRGHVRRLQHHEARRLQRLLVQADRIAHLANQQAGESMGEGLGLAMRQIEQDVGNIARLLGEVDAGDGVGAIFVFSELGGLGVRCRVRQRVDRRALHIAPRFRQRVGMDGNEKLRLGDDGQTSPCRSAG